MTIHCVCVHRYFALVQEIGHFCHMKIGREIRSSILVVIFWCRTDFACEANKQTVCLRSKWVIVSIFIDIGFLVSDAHKSVIVPVSSVPLIDAVNRFFLISQQSKRTVIIIIIDWRRDVSRNGFRFCCDLQNTCAGRFERWQNMHRTQILRRTLLRHIHFHNRWVGVTCIRSGDKGMLSYYRSSLFCFTLCVVAPRNRFQAETHQFGRRPDQTTNLGYGRPRTIPNADNGLLSRCNGHSTHVWCHQFRVVQQLIVLVKEYSRSESHFSLLSPVTGQMIMYIFTQNAAPDVVKVLVGNKCEATPTQRMVEKDRGVKVIHNKTVIRTLYSCFN